MESILFNQLTESDYGQDNDELLLQQNGITKRIKSKNFFDGAIANAMHEKYTAGRLLVADDDGNIAESEKTEADLDRAGSAVTYTEQTLTDAQKAQARSNVGLNDNITIAGNKTFTGLLKGVNIQNYSYSSSGTTDSELLNSIYNSMQDNSCTINNVNQGGGGKLIILFRFNANYGGGLWVDYNNGFWYCRRYNSSWSFKTISMS